METLVAIRSGWRGWLARPLTLAIAALAIMVLNPITAVSAEQGDALRDRVLAIIAGRSGDAASGTHLAALTAFYQNQDIHPLWVTDGRANDRAYSLINVLRAAGDEALDPDDYGSELLASRLEAVSPIDLAYLEANLSLALLTYTHHLSAGRLDPQRISEELAVAPSAANPLDVLLGAASTTDMQAYARDSYVPQTPRYERMRTALAHYRNLASAGGWPRTADGPLLKEGMEDAARVPTLRERLVISGYLEAGAHTGETFDGALVAALKLFQARHGLEVDGVVGKNTLTELNVSAAERARQIGLNMERRRWMEDDLGEFYVFVNLADQFLKVVEVQGDEEKTLHTARTVVGKSYHRSPVFTDQMTYVVVNPTWVVPRSIAVNEYLPKLRENPSALDEDNIRLVSTTRDVDPYSIDWTSVTERTFAWELRQRPGVDNALGEIKFIFPNKFNVYIHDTPAKHLFERAQRTFSHGCIRVEKPFDLAELLLQRQGVTRAHLEELRAARAEHIIPLDKPIPVHIHYLTAWVNKDGTVHFRRDAYERDVALEKALRAARRRPI